jgi:hypothetical protein
LGKHNRRKAERLEKLLRFKAQVSQGGTSSMISEEERAFPLPKDPPSRQDEKRSLLFLNKWEPLETKEEFAQRVIQELQKADSRLRNSASRAYWRGYGNCYSGSSFGEKRPNEALRQRALRSARHILVVKYL